MQLTFGWSTIRRSIPTAAVVLSGCGPVPLLAPKGPIGEAERFVMLASCALMLIVVIPVFIMIAWFSWKYRAGNKASVYAPKWSYSRRIDLTIWLVPVAVIAVLGALAWTTTHRLDPFKPIQPGVEAIRVEAVALDWKWLFIYPDHGVASVSQLVFPAGVFLSLRITSDTVITSFFIPRLGSQIYAMAGRQTHLHLMADTPGSYSGHNQQFSGRGYADMHFTALATTPERFDAWVQSARQASKTLDLARYQQLAQPSQGYPVTVFSSVAPGLFNHILDRYRYGDDKADPAGQDRPGFDLQAGAPVAMKER